MFFATELNVAQRDRLLGLDHGRLRVVQATQGVLQTMLASRLLLHHLNLRVVGSHLGLALILLADMLVSFNGIAEVRVLGLMACCDLLLAHFSGGGFLVDLRQHL